jgi:hypothetical protein
MKNENSYELEPTGAPAPSPNFRPDTFHFQNTPFAEISNGVVPVLATDPG